MKKSQNTKRNLLTSLWNAAGSALWLYNIKLYNNKEKLVDSEQCSEKLKKLSHTCYKIDYVLFFSLVCAYGAGKALAKAFEPEPIEESEKSESSENDFREVTE